MKFLEAANKMLSAYELRYWAVIAAGVMLVDSFYPLNDDAIIITFICLFMGGWLAGIRIQNEEDRLNEMFK